jgi:hypothetical protein
MATASAWSYKYLSFVRRADMRERERERESEGVSEGVRRRGTSRRKRHDSTTLERILTKLGAWVNFHARVAIFASACRRKACGMGGG